jgi:beta-lactam-binding protein with PASTA domain
MGTGKVILIAAVTSVVVSAGTFFGLRAVTGAGSGSDGAVVVPPLAGLRTDQARKLLETKELLLVVTEQREDPQVAEGLIASQVPLEGSKVKQGAEVRVIVSKGSPQVMVPATARLPLAAALQTLTTAGFKVSTTTRQNDPQIEKDHVISSLPQQGQQAPKGSTVSLVVSEGPTGAKVPNVVNKGLGRARRELEEAGFKVGRVTYYYNEDRPPSVVLRQTPEADAMAPAGSEIQLVVNESD